MGPTRASALATRSKVLRAALSAHWDLQDKLHAHFATFGEAVHVATLLGLPTAEVEIFDEYCAQGNWARHSPPPGAWPKPPKVPTAAVCAPALESFREGLFQGVHESMEEITHNVYLAEVAKSWPGVPNVTEPEAPFVSDDENFTNASNVGMSDGDGDVDQRVEEPADRQPADLPVDDDAMEFNCSDTSDASEEEGDVASAGRLLSPLGADTKAVSLPCGPPIVDNVQVQLEQQGEAASAPHTGHEEPGSLIPSAEPGDHASLFSHLRLKHGRHDLSGICPENYEACRRGEYYFAVKAGKHLVPCALCRRAMALVRRVGYNEYQCDVCQQLIEKGEFTVICVGCDFSYCAPCAFGHYLKGYPQRGAQVLDGG